MAGRRERNVPPSDEPSALLASDSPALHPSSVAHCSVGSYKCLCVTDSYFQTFILLVKLTVITKDPLEVIVNQITEHPPGQKVSR